MNQVKRGLMVVLIAGVAMLLAAPATAAPREPSPFQGEWCGFLFSVTISKSGGISGTGSVGAETGRLSGRVTNDGVMTVTLSYRVVYDDPRFGRVTRNIRLRGIGSVEIDGDGHLVGILTWENHEPFPIEWIRCSTLESSSRRHRAQALSSDPPDRAFARLDGADLAVA